VWGRDLRSLSFSSLAHVPLGFLILCFGISLVWGQDLRAPFPPHLRMFPWGFDLVLEISLVGVGICALPFLSSLAHVPLGF
jgi:hypothetical protein